MRHLAVDDVAARLDDLVVLVNLSLRKIARSGTNVQSAIAASQAESF